MSNKYASYASHALSKIHFFLEYVELLHHTTSLEGSSALVAQTATSQASSLDQRHGLESSEALTGISCTHGSL